jgi:hypothetical protein
MKTRRDNNPATEERYLRAVDRKTINTEMIAATGKAELELRETVESHDNSEPELSPLLAMKPSGNYAPTGMKFKPAS